MSSLKRKLEAKVEIRESAADVLHDILSSKPHHVSHAASHFVQAVDLHEGDHGKLGCTNVWKYTFGPFGGKSFVAKSILEEIDEEKKYVRNRVIEGDLLDEYKTMTGKFHVIPKDEKTSIAKWTLEYEKQHPGIPEPTELLDSWLAAIKDLDDHHHGINKEVNNHI